VNIETCEAFRIDELGELSFAQLIECSGMTEAELRELIEYGALVPVDPATPSWMFRGDALPIARSAGRLRREFDLDLHGIAVLLRFIERIQELEAELRALRAGVSGTMSAR
jgi:chaperone modulatory protein CbpM